MSRCARVAVEQHANHQAEDQDGQNKNRGICQTYKKIFALATSHDRLLYGIGLVAAVASGAVLPVMTLIFGRFVSVFTGFALERLSEDEFRGEVSHYALYFVYLFIAKAGCTYLYMVCFTIAAANVSATIRVNYLRTTLHRRIAFHETALTSGEVSLALSSHSNTIRAGLAEKLGLSLKSLSTIVAAFIVALTTQWKLALVTATLVPAIIVIVGVPGALDEKLEKSLNGVKSQAATLAEEIFSSVRTVRSLGAEEVLCGRYRALLKAARRIGLRRAPFKGLVAGLYMFTLYSGYALAFWYGVKLFAEGQVASSGVVVTTLFSIIIAVNGFAELTSYSGAFVRIYSAANELFNVIDGVGDETPAAPLDTAIFRGEIRFDGVSFAYPTRTGTNVLDRLELTCPAGETTALVGASGSGKSTIVGLILRWYDASHGCISIGGQDLSSVSFDTLRAHVGLVQQEPCLFTGTVYENVANGLAGTALHHLSPGEKMKLVQDACKTANAHEFIITLPESYHTPIGNRGTMLSGGQKQRLAIARAIVKNPPILILDEATSALDVTSEAAVHQALDNARASRTTISIAHRLSTIRAADQIVVLKGGRVAELGSHDDLVGRREGIYRGLWEAQSVQHVSDADETSMSPAYSMEEDHVPGEGTMEKIPSNQNAVSDDKQPQKGAWTLVSMILEKHSKYWPVFVVLLASAAIGGALYPLQAFLYSKVISIFELTGDALQSRGNFWSLIWLVLAIIVGLGFLGIGWAGSVLAEVIGQTCRGDYFTSILDQRVAYFDRKENSADNLVSRLSTDPDAVNALVGDNIGVLGTVFVSVVSTTVLALAVGWKLGLVVLFGGLPFIFGAGVIRERMEQSFEEKAGAMSTESVAYASECLQAIKTVSALNMEPIVEDKFRRLMAEFCARSSRNALRSMIWFALSESVEFLCMALAFWYGGRLLSYHEYSNTQFFIVFVAIVFGSQSSGQFFAHGSDVSKGIASAQAIYNLDGNTSASSGLDVPPAVDIDPSIPLLEFRNVSFAYPSRPAQRVLSNFNLRVFADESVALVGASGSGKTTAIQLLERFYDANAGQVLVSGVPIEAYASGSLRRILALVGQEPVLYQGSVADNINLGRSSPLQGASLDAVLTQSQLTDVVASLPDGVHTEVGSRGGQLSGGQKQRVAIARAVAMETPVLLLDEATSALDSGSERLIQAAIRQTAAQHKTVLAVAHRLSTIQHFDRIVVMHEGRVAESGAHDELMAARGRYWSMVEQQAGY